MGGDGHADFWNGDCAQIESNGRNDAAPFFFRGQAVFEKMFFQFANFSLAAYHADVVCIAVDAAFQGFRVGAVALGYENDVRLAVLRERGYEFANLSVDGFCRSRK